MDNYHKMRVSNDTDRSDPKDLCSLGVVDLDLSLSPDVFDLRAFDSSKPLTRMLPGSSPCELRLMLPDGEVGPEGFHDVINRHLKTGSVRDLVNELRQRFPGKYLNNPFQNSSRLVCTRSPAVTRTYIPNPEWVLYHSNSLTCL